MAREGSSSVVLAFACLCGCQSLIAENERFETGADTSSDTTGGATSDGCADDCELLGQTGECVGEGDSVECQGIIELPATEDVYVRVDGDNGINGEGELRLIVANTPRTDSFIAGPELELLPASAVIDGAQLRLTSLDDGDVVFGRVISEAWSAKSINWMNKPPIEAESIMVDPAAGKVWVDVGVVTQQWRDGSIPNHGIALLSSDGGSAEFLALESGAGPVYELTLRW